MGDSIVGFVVADLIFEQYPKLQEGLMSKMKSFYIQTKSLANHARRINLNEYIKLGKGERRHNSQEKDKVLEDVFEAFVGALYKDQGILFAQEFLKNLFYEEICNFNIEQLTDYKTRLQEEIQSDSRENVRYEEVSRSGPPHKLEFVYAVYFKDVKLGTGTGFSIKEAEQNAAKDALQKKAILKEE